MKGQGKGRAWLILLVGVEQTVPQEHATNMGEHIQWRRPIVDYKGKKGHIDRARQVYP